DLVANGPSQQFVDRLAEDFATNVPESDVDGTDAFHGRTAAAHVGEPAEDLVPQVLDARRIFARDRSADVLEHRAESPIGEFGRGGNLAPTADALVGGDFDVKKLTPVRSARL